MGKIALVHSIFFFPSDFLSGRTKNHKCILTRKKKIHHLGCQALALPTGNTHLFLN